jgi:hypothetical protein
MYRLSVVIFQRRNLTLQPRQETVAEVIVGESLLQGSVKQVMIDELVPPPTAEDAGVRELRGGHWIALIQQVNVPQGVNNQNLKWYRVISTDEPDGDADINRVVSLTGPDWNVRFSAGPVYAVYVRNVVAVYEKTVRLHNSSLYAM